MIYHLFFCEGVSDSFLIHRILHQYFEMHEIKEKTYTDELNSIAKLFDKNRFFCCANVTNTVLIIRCDSKKQTLRTSYSILRHDINGNSDAEKLILSAGVFIDMDEDSPETLIQKIKNGYKDLEVPGTLSEIRKGKPSLGFWSFPDCVNQGAIERMLLNLAEKTFPDLKNASKNYVNSVPEKYKKSDGNNPWNFRRFDKSFVASMAAILQESGRVTDSIANDKWFPVDKIPEQKQLIQFIDKLISAEN